MVLAPKKKAPPAPKAKAEKAKPDKPKMGPKAAAA